MRLICIRSYPIPVLKPTGRANIRVESRLEPAGLVTNVTLASSGEPESEVHWALLADPHISADTSQSYLGFRPKANLQETADQVTAAGPDLVHIAGDLAWTEGLPEDYERFRDLMKPIAGSVPTILALGNHDNRANFQTAFRECFPAAERPEKLITVVEQPPVRWIMLDSLVRTDIVAGLLGKAQRAWLREFLQSSDDSATFLCVHHPLDDEDDSLLDGDRLLALLQPFPNVKAVFHGHDHVFRIDERDGIFVVSLPAIGFPFEESERVGWVEARLSPQGGSFSLRTLAENGPEDRRTISLEWHR